MFLNFRYRFFGEDLWCDWVETRVSRSGEALQVTRQPKVRRSAPLVPYRGRGFGLSHRACHDEGRDCGGQFCELTAMLSQECASWHVV
jgi:hypothetical protein